MPPLQSSLRCQSPSSWHVLPPAATLSFSFPASYFSILLLAFPIWLPPKGWVLRAPPCPPFPLASLVKPSPVINCFLLSGTHAPEENILVLNLSSSPPRILQLYYQHMSKSFTSSLFLAPYATCHPVKPLTNHAWEHDLPT